MPRGFFPLLPPLLSLVFFLHRYTCNFQRDGCLFISFRVAAHGWVAPLCHTRARYNFNLEADCQKLKSLDSPGTQPALSDALVNHWLAETHCENSRFKIQVMHILIQSKQEQNNCYLAVVKELTLFLFKF